MKPGTLLLLNGPPSCGKTSLARAFVTAAPTPWFHMSLDDFRRGYQSRHWRNDDGALFEHVMTAYIAMLREAASAEIDVIAEAVITPSRRQLYAEKLGTTPTFLVAVRCRIEVARQRELAREDRLKGPIELPADAFRSVHDGIAHDVDLDTSDLDSLDVAADLLAALAVRSPCPISEHF